MKPEEQMEPKGREQAVTESVLERLGAQALAEADKAEERLKGGYYMMSGRGVLLLPRISNRAFRGLC